LSDFSLVDTHAHLDHPRLLNQLTDVLERARAANVWQVVSQSTSAESSERVVALASQHDALFAAVGIHPNDAVHAGEGDWSRVNALLDHPKVVAVGETGLDRYWDTTPFATQIEYFSLHLTAAFERNLPVVIHCRDSAQDILALLEALGRPMHGVLHSFTGDRALAGRFLDLGLHLGFAGQVTFSNKSLDSLREVAAHMPLDRVLLETDSPYLAPHPHRGRGNEPAYMAFTAERIAELRGISVAALAKATTANARRLFGLPTTACGI
jgi:TatD DNase family protein